MHPLGFEISDSRVKRAGLDYWPKLKFSQYDSFDQVLTQVQDGQKMFFFSSRGAHSFYSTYLEEDDWLIFGRESTGLPAELIETNRDRSFHIPFPGEIRSFNLSNAVAMVLGEGMRQLGC